MSGSRRLLGPAPAFALLLLLTAACGGGGGRPTPPAPTPSAGLQAQVAITIDWGAAGTSTARAVPAAVHRRAMPAGTVVLHAAPAARSARPSYISPSTQAINLYTQAGGGAISFAASVPNPCSGGCPPTTTTTTTISVPTGYNTFYAAAFDTCGTACQSGSTAGSGNVLAYSASGSVLSNVTIGGPNTVTVTLNGFVANVQFSVFPSGKAKNVTVNPQDADSNTITGSSTPYANGPVTLAFADPDAQFSGFPSTAPTYSTPGSIQPLKLNGGGTDCTAVLTAATKSYQPPAYLNVGYQSLGLWVQSLQSTGSAMTATGHFGRISLCWQPISGAVNYYLYRNTSQPVGSTQYVAFVNSPGVSSWQDYNVLTGNHYYYKICGSGPTILTTCSTADFNLTTSSYYDPLSVAGTQPTAWLDGNDSSSFQSIGGGQYFWSDKRASAHGEMITTNGQPTTSPIGFGRQSFSGNYLTAYYISNAPPEISTPLSIVAAAAQTTYTAGWQRLVNIGGFYADHYGFVGTLPNGSSPGLVASFWGNTDVPPVSKACSGTWCDTHFNGPQSTWGWQLPPEPNLPSIFVVDNDGSCPDNLCPGASSGLGGPIAWLNGGKMNQDHNGSMSTPPVSYTGGFSIGLYGGTGVPDQGWDGDIGDILIYPVILQNVTNAAGTTHTAQQVLEGYLACKWGSQGALPVTHPYSAGKACP
jgi:hypothetical protein